MDIDKLFKIPQLPKGKGKRQLPDNPSPEVLKRLKVDHNPNIEVARSYKATVEDVISDGEGDQVVGDDADNFVDEDSEGRFYGGGLTDAQKDILNLFDKAPDAEGNANMGFTGQMNLPSIRRTLSHFEKAFDRNQEQRSKNPDDPTKFIDSESDLDVCTKSLLPLAQVGTISYPELIKIGAASKIIGLLSHENLDIVSDAIEVIKEFTDEDVDENVGDEAENRDEALKTLVDALAQNSLLELLAYNLSRFDENEESDRQAIHNILGIFENIVGVDPQLAVTLVTTTSIMKWLLQRIEAPTHDENRSYAGEFLSILLQNNLEVSRVFGTVGGVDTLLQVASFRKRDPVDAEEWEFMDNIFDALASSTSYSANRRLFHQGEGVELMILMLKEKLECRSRALKILDHALSTASGSENCETFVREAGLKALFAVFMGTSKTVQKSVATSASEDAGHCLGIISSLLSNLPSESVERLRLLTKFVEADYSTLDRVLEVREGANRRLQSVATEINAEKKRIEEAGDEINVEREAEWYLKRLDSGLYTLQCTDYILAWVIMEDDGIRGHVEAILSRHSKSLKDIVNVLEEQLEGMSDEVEGFESGEMQTNTQKSIVEGLLSYLRPI